MVRARLTSTRGDLDVNTKCLASRNLHSNLKNTQATIHKVEESSRTKKYSNPTPPPTTTMSRDSSHTYIHMHSAHHADLFEDFCRPPSSSSSPSTTGPNTTNTTADPSMQNLPGAFLPFESINLPPHLQPVNPEDEDDVVPDMHAAFGIMRALGRGEEGGVVAEPAWRDLGLGGLVDGGVKKEGTVTGGAKREGRKTGLLLMR